jgi:copper chaperone CopZ
MCAEENEIYDAIEALNIESVRVKMVTGSTRIYKILFDDNIEGKRFVVFKVTEEMPDSEAWMLILKNTLVTALAEARDVRIDDKDVLIETIASIGEAMRHAGITGNDLIKLMSYFAE